MKTIKVGGMSCGHCTASVQKVLEGFPEIGRVEVSLEKGEASFEEKRPVDPSKVKEAIRKIGFEAN
ncbi:MAG TPA: heavy metal-associated domain-containing protein [Desulfomicrobiaceae bacterium]|nr:heavy metal-associated domain-containing protein [Desulfomicrobiaceae bacterium]